MNIIGLYGIADAEASGGDPERIAAAMLAGGCLLIQLRAKGWNLQDTERVAQAIQKRCNDFGATFIVNDHPEICVAVGADGVHIGQLDGDIARARAIVGSNRLIGRSTNDLTQVAIAAIGADYVAFGPVWSTPNAGRPKQVRGIEALRAARAALPEAIPLVAIGGITLNRLPLVRSVAESWAIIGAIAGSESPVSVTRALR